MVSIAVLFGDQKAMAAHAAGLRQIIHLRGGFRALDHNPMVQFSLDRLNFSNALVTQQWTPLYDSSIWKEPIFMEQLTGLDCTHEKVSVTGLIDSRLEPVFRTLQETTVLFNNYFHRHERIEGRFAQQCLGFVHSKLLDLTGHLTDDFSENFCLGMMAFLATTFRIPDLGVQRVYRGVSEKLQLSIAFNKARTAHLHEKINIWFMFVRTMFTESRDGLQVPTWWIKAIVHKRSWEEIRCCLKEVLWVDSFHDEPGKRAYSILAKEE
ncbi:unnamed protein product [Clonostachys rosea]|uniref:Uncharacterized protein n=1 Tax=Bionectria ochroleuca TaxID=29856 RepID=A0ABY6UUL4_BIOOC|nr:unnamed protein product [Clonostachys rosea]